MKIEKLNKDRIKVSLSSTDLYELDIDVKKLSPNSQELHSFLFQIMETIREETGFNPYNGQVVVEATPSTEGMDIMVSRVSGKKRKITKQEFSKITSVKAKVKKNAETAIFFFKDFDDLCMAIKMADKEALMMSSLYKIGDTYCFTIKNDTLYKKCIAMMREYSSSISGRTFHLAHLKEHGKLIASGHKLSEMAENLRQFT